MYGEIDARTRHLAAAVGINLEIVRIFTSRIPKKISKRTAKGKYMVLDGDTICFSVLDSLCELKNQLSFSSEFGQKVKDKYTCLVNKVKDNPNLNIHVPSFERFVIQEFISPYMPRAYKISFDDLTSREIIALYEWVVI